MLKMLGLAKPDKAGEESTSQEIGKDQAHGTNHITHDEAIYIEEKVEKNGLAISHRPFGTDHHSVDVKISNPTTQGLQDFALDVDETKARSSLEHTRTLNVNSLQIGKKIVSDYTGPEPEEINEAKERPQPEPERAVEANTKNMPPATKSKGFFSIFQKQGTINSGSTKIDSATTTKTDLATSTKTESATTTKNESATTMRTEKQTKKKSTKGFFWWTKRKGSGPQNAEQSSPETETALALDSAKTDKKSVSVNTVTMSPDTLAQDTPENSAVGGLSASQKKKKNNASWGFSRFRTKSEDSPRNTGKNMSTAEYPSDQVVVEEDHAKRHEIKHNKSRFRQQSESGPRKFTKKISAIGHPSDQVVLEDDHDKRQEIKLIKIPNLDIKDRQIDPQSQDPQPQEPITKELETVKLEQSLNNSKIKDMSPKSKLNKSELSNGYESPSSKNNTGGKSPRIERREERLDTRVATETNELMTQNAERGSTLILPTKPKVRTSLRFIGYITFYFLSAIVIAIVAAIIANNYPNLPAEYHRWGQALFEGLFLAAAIAAILRTVLIRAEIDNPFVTYGHFWATALVAFIFSPLVSVAFFAIVDSSRYPDQIPDEALVNTENPSSVRNWGLRSQFYYLLCQLPVVCVNALIYHVYFYFKKKRHVKHVQSQRKSFFYADIYKNFQQELTRMKNTLHEKARRGTSFQHHNSPLKRSVTRRTRRVSESMADIVGTTQHKFKKVVSLARNWAVHLMLVLLFAQFLLSFGYMAVVRASIDNDLQAFIYIGAGFYPLITGIMKAITKKIASAYEVGIETPPIHMISMTIAAVTYRFVYFMIDSEGQAVGIILVKVGYKVLVYIIYGEAIENFQKIGEQAAKKWKDFKNKLKTKLKRTDHKSPSLKSPSLRSPSIRTVGLSFFERVTVNAYNAKQHLQFFSIQFVLVQIADMTAIIASCIVLAIFNNSSLVQSVFKQRYSADKVNKIIEFAGIELIFDVALIIVMMYILKKNTLFKDIKLLRILNNILRYSIQTFMCMNMLAYYTYYLVFTYFF